MSQNINNNKKHSRSEEDIVMENRWITIIDDAENSCISIGSYDEIFLNFMGMKYVVAKFVAKEHSIKITQML